LERSAAMVTRNRRLLQRGLWVEYGTLAWMTIECLASIYSGILAWSLALLAFGGDSLVELLSSLTVTRHLRNVVRGSESELETKRTEWVAAFLLLSLIPVIGVAAIYSYTTGITPESSLLGIAVAVGAIVIMPVLWYEKKRIGTAANCVPLTIDAAESATCFWMSLALLSGLTINFVWKIAWVDYATTVAILAFVAKEATETIHEIL
jgi:divalent metal cation (Fe/Co/Zn/Cd) transporter